MLTTPGTERAERTAFETPRPRLKRRTDQPDDDRSDDGQKRPTRKAPRKATQTRKRGTTHADTESPHESKSVRDLAKPHLLTVAKLQLKALKPNWSTGSNRQLDADRVSKLKNVFKKDGLKRTAQENWLLCVCNAADISKLWPDENSLDRGHCSEVMPQLIEVLNGQHRIAALRDYVSDTGNDEADLWWMCELYNQETLPKHLAQIMRFNPTEPTMSARLNHAQVWMELVNITSPTGDDRGCESDAENSEEEQSMNLDYSLIEAFRIACKAELPSRRLATLWNNRPWRRVITQWCQTRLGMDTFAISFTAWTAGLRIDEYFFEMMDSTLNTLRSLPLDTAIHVDSSDWDQLADMYETAEDQTPDVLSTFYESAGSKRTRSRGLLTSLSDAEYDAFYQHMKTANHYTFPRPHRISRSHIQAMVQVLHHVIAWIDPEMITTLLQQSRGAQSKPLIRTYLRDALGNFARSNGMPNFRASEEQAIAMQKSILEFAREQADEFLNCPVVPTFFTGASAPDLMTTDYTMRFGNIVWTQLLHFTRELLANVTGSTTLTFRQEWDRMADMLPTLSELPGHLCRIIANAKDPAAKAIVASALQEALATIRKPVRGQGTSETAKSDSASYFTGTSLEAASESLPTIEILSRRDDQLPGTRQSAADHGVFASSCKWDLVDVAIHHMKDRASIAGNKARYNKLDSASFRDELGEWLEERCGTDEESIEGGHIIGETDIDVGPVESGSCFAVRSRLRGDRRWVAPSSTGTGGGEEDWCEPSVDDANSGLVFDNAMPILESATVTPSMAGFRRTQQEAPDGQRPAQPPFTLKSPSPGPEVPPSEQPGTIKTKPPTTLADRMSCEIHATENRRSGLETGHTKPTTGSRKTKRGHKSGTLCWFRA
ncbi:uncharacterized protein CPUR_06860 [Claviceps purpurea 20.1]|uniref:Uncharacterized protein n=1 Tax=Claviceps purpurea (strain 20.1) TaxID=1111077 RepID=M1WEP5_CLAP2|nr:hypothetical protein E4U24_000079 [Claviceps purpurea]CCE32938.1 uncharacterized protein CPUR_06860 [Claviceps purpurea 20.1]